MKTSPKTPLVIAWLVVVLASLLPRVILQEVFHQAVTLEQQQMMALGVILAALLAALLWKPLSGLRPFLIFFAVWVIVQWAVYNHLDTLPVFRRWLRDPSFGVSMLAEQLLHLVIVVVVIAALLLLGKRPREFYLALGDLSAPAERVRWLGIDQGTPWSKLGIILSVCISLGTLTFLVLAGQPSADIVVRALPFLPAVLLAAALNSFYEEMSYKAAFLSVLEGPVGMRQAVYMVAFYFGVAHFYGVPYGLIGVVLAGFLGWILAKSMQETRGLFWAWFIHFLQDVWIFAFMALGSITPGG